ncbi:MAG: BamA/TamA family outer membrane protein [Gemmatimonadaceae bacterium]
MPRTRRRALLRALVIPAACSAAVTTTAGAQRDPIPAKAPADSAAERAQSWCHGQPIVGITIRSVAPTAAGARRIPLLRDIVDVTHVNTRPQIVRRFLLLQEGDRCIELRRAESERILRAQPFIADARIAVLPAEEPGAVELDVQTVDEASLVVGAMPEAGMPPLRQLRLGNANLAGLGVYAAADWRDREPRRDEYAARLVDNQFLEQPWVLSLAGRRSDRGGNWESALFRPFLTGLQRYAWHVGGGASVGYVGLEAPGEATRGVRVDRGWGDAGAIARVGPPDRLGLLGFGMTYERERAGRSTLLLNDTGVSPDPRPILLDYERLTAARFNAFVGFRALRFVRVQGMDALSATQDLPVGFQLGGMMGRGITAFGSDEADRFFASDLSFGAGDEERAMRGQLRGEARRASGRFDDVVFTGRVAQYFKPNWRRTLVFAAEWGGGSKQRIPYQLRLGAPEAGVRGWNDARLAGGWRGVLQVEDRHLVGRIGSLGDIGWGWFADAGRVWRGDAPVARTTPVRGSVGVSLLGAVPVGSARLWRVDLAFPLGEGAGKRVALVFSHNDRTRVFWREPGDVTALHARSQPSSVFDWP